MSRTNREVAQDALDHLVVLRAHLSRGDLDDQTVADAVSPRLAATIADDLPELEATLLTEIGRSGS